MKEFGPQEPRADKQMMPMPYDHWQTRIRLCPKLRAQSSPRLLLVTYSCIVDKVFRPGFESCHSCCPSSLQGNIFEHDASNRQHGSQYWRFKPRVGYNK